MKAKDRQDQPPEGLRMTTKLVLTGLASAAGRVLGEVIIRHLH